MGMWYTRKEAQKRFTFFFSSTTLAGAFGGLLATGLGQMNGLRGYSGWRWIFIIEGVLTCVVSLFWFFVIPDFPEDVKWLSDEERVYLNAKLTEDVGPSARYQPLTVRDILHTFKDCK
jgi:MFS family permease